MYQNIFINETKFRNDDEDEDFNLQMAIEMSKQDINFQPAKRRKTTSTLLNGSQHFTDSGHLRLLCIRNPWGRREWTGK